MGVKDAYTEFETLLFEVAKSHFSKVKHIERYNIFKNAKIRFEDWFKAELIYAWHKKGIYSTGKGVKAFDADVLVKNQDGKKTGVELRVTRFGTISAMTHAFRDHTRAELYMFLAYDDKNVLEKLKKICREYKYVPLMKKLRDEWHLIMVKKL